MSTLNKILIWVGAIVTICLLSFIVYTQIEISNRQLAIETQVVQQKQLIDNIVRSQSSWASKDDINKFITSNGVNVKAIQDDLDKLHAQISTVNAVIVTSNGQRAINIPSTNVGVVNPNPIDPINPDKFGYLSRQQNLDLNEDFNGTKVPIGNVGFSAWQQAPWNLTIFPREYHVTNIVGVDENQRTYVYNKFSVKIANKSYDVKIAQSQTEQVYPEAKWYLWNPRLFMGVDGGVNLNQVKGEFTPSINVGSISYGKYKIQPDFSVLELGVGYGSVSMTPQVIVTPFTYNIGKHIPLMNNTYIESSLHANVSGEFSIMAGLRIGL